MPTKTKSNKRKLSAQQIITIIWLIVFIINVALYFWPQCPAYYTQAQVDASYCNVGANIGVGIMAILLTMPFTVVVAIMWAVTYTLRFVRHKK